MGAASSLRRVRRASARSARRAARRTGDTAIVQAALRHARRGPRRPQPRTGRVWDVADRFARFERVTAEQRERSVDGLVSMFFELVDGWDVDLFVEAGAKEATASQRAASTPGRRVVAFEANPYTHRRFAGRLAGSGVEYRHLALAASPGTVTFNVQMAADGRPAADGQGSLHARAEPTRGELPVTVTATTLDAHFGDVTGSRVAMWVDVEGATEQVLSGGDRFLRSVVVMIVEVEEHRYWGDGQWLSADVVRHLAGAGLVRVARDAQSRFQHNAVFVRDDRLADPVLAAAYERFRADPT